MKEIIKEVLDKYKNSQLNLNSDSTIEMIADKIVQSINGHLEVERMKLAEQIVEHSEEGYIFESPDNGKTIFRRDIGDYDPMNKIEIDWETKKPTGRKFRDYNNGNWKVGQKMYPWHDDEG